MEKNIQHLTIFLTKEALRRSRDIVKTDQCETPIEIHISGFGRGRLYVKRTNNIRPKWTSLFTETGLVDLRVDSVGAAFLFEVDAAVDQAAPVVAPALLRVPNDVHDVPCQWCTANLVNRHVQTPSCTRAPTQTKANEKCKQQGECAAP